MAVKTADSIDMIQNNKNRICSGGYHETALEFF